jgi:Mycothiol maleylpyruvate isomerase N-terminal domain
MLDLAPATTTLAALVNGVRDDQLSARTPCTESTLADLLDHVDGLSQAFTAAATKSNAENNQPSVLV